jgi:hypothetical protein
VVIRSQIWHQPPNLIYVAHAVRASRYVFGQSSSIDPISLLNQEQDVFDAFNKRDSQENGVDNENMKSAKGQLAARLAQWSAP